MRDIEIFWIIGISLFVGGGSTLAILRRRHQRDLREFLEPDLRKCGVTFISAVYPGSFKVGPFPTFEGPGSRPQTTIGGIRGEYNEYRIVTFSDPKGAVFRLWALVEFEMFQFRRVRWRAEQKDSLPQSVLSIVEN
jgi:hypothetical protein